MLNLARIASVTLVGDRGVIVRDAAGRMLIITEKRWLAVDPVARTDRIRRVVRSPRSPNPR